MIRLDLEDCDPKEFFDDLARYGTPFEKPGLEGFVEMPGVGTLGYRTVSKSGHPTIDATISGIGVKEMKFV